MTERSESAQIQFNKTNPPLVIPDELLLEARRSVQGMSPDDIAFAKPNTVVIDNGTSRLLIDTQDPLPPLIEKLQQRELQPALLRLVRLVGHTAYDGYLVDMRYVRKPPIVNRSEQDEEPLEQTEQWQVLGTANPLGALFLSGDHVQYVGELELEETGRRFAECVDKYYRALHEGKNPDDCYQICIDHFKNEKNVL